MKIPLFPVGTRVRIRKGPLPMDASLVGRSGIVLHHAPSSGRKVSVQLDEEEQLRTFTDDELEAL